MNSLFHEIKRIENKENSELFRSRNVEYNNQYSQEIIENNRVIELLERIKQYHQLSEVTQKNVAKRKRTIKKYRKFHIKRKGNLYTNHEVATEKHSNKSEDNVIKNIHGSNFKRLSQKYKND